MAMIVSGSLITYGSYRLLKFFNRQKDHVSYKQFMQEEDVEATLVTLRRFLDAKSTKSRNDPYKELRQQFAHVKEQYEFLDSLIKWRKQKLYRHFYWSGETDKFITFQIEWGILMSPLRLIKALLYLDKNVL